MIISPKKHEETEGETVEMDDFRSWKSVGLVSLGVIVVSHGRTTSLRGWNAFISFVFYK